jgi:hypothetical protein
MGVREHCGDTTINTKTTPCIVNDPLGGSHSVIPVRLHDAFVIDVSLFRQLVQAALNIISWYEGDVMPPHCHLIRDLQEFKDCPEIMAEEVSDMIRCEGIVTINPNRDWFTGRRANHRDGDYLPCAVTVGMYTVPISRKEAIRWLGDKEWGADYKTEVEPKTVEYGRPEFETIRVADLGCHSRYSDMEWNMRGYTSKLTAMRLVKYAEAKLEDQQIVNDPIVRAFHQDGANYTAQQIQVSRLTDEEKLFYPLGRAPSNVEEYYRTQLPAHEIIQQPGLCEDNHRKSVLKLARKLQIGDYITRKRGAIPPIPDSISGPYTLIPDQPISSCFGWIPELMDPMQAAYTRSSVEVSHGLTKKAAARAR